MGCQIEQYHEDENGRDGYYYMGTVVDVSSVRTNAKSPRRATAVLNYGEGSLPRTPRSHKCLYLAIDCVSFM